MDVCFSTQWLAYAIRHRIGKSTATGVQSWVSRSQHQLPVRSLRTRRVAYARPGWEEADSFEPIDAIRTSDADLDLIFMSARGIRFTEPVDDPWFAAHREGRRPPINPKSTPLYLQDEPVGVLGCLSQVQYCNPNLKEGERCEPLRGKNVDPSGTISKLWQDQRQRDFISAFNDVLVDNIIQIWQFAGYVGSAALRARYDVFSSLSGPLPPNQWQLEMEYWMQGLLVSVQSSVVMFVYGAPTKNLEPHMREPAANETGLRYLCGRQVRWTSAHATRQASH
jgi:hypothetical protein